VKLARALALPFCTLVAAGAAGCFSAPPRPQIPTPEPAPATAPPATSVPDAVPRIEPRSRSGNPPFYDVFGKRYFVLSSSVGYVERGVASWYGPGFHKVRTSIGEPYDMYGMTAAHKTLPLPAYVRVTNLQNGLSVVVRVNDRGPFVGNRIIDLSYTAASKLGMLRNGTAIVEVRSLDAPPALNAATTNAPATLNAATTPSAATTPGTAAATSAAAPSKTAAPVDAPVTAAGFAPAAAPSTDSSSGAVSLVAVPAPGSLFIQAGAFSDPKNAERLVDRLRGGAYGKVFVRDNEIAGRRMYRVRIGPVPDVAEYDRIVAALERAGVHDAHLALD
jgi:rare lipoprotein A